MFKISGEVGYRSYTHIVNEGIVLNNWHSSIIVNCYKRIKQLDLVMKVRENCCTTDS